MFTYHIAREGEHIKEIVIQNVDDERLKELKSISAGLSKKCMKK